MRSERESLVDRLDAASREAEEAARQVAVQGRAFGPDIGVRERIEGAKMRLRIALDELDGYPATADDITEE